MILFIDLDGTLVNTADIQYKRLKDGLEDFNPSSIPIFPGAVDFISELQTNGNRVIILSDSHPNYVPKIVEYFFHTEYLCLADKPNIAKTLDFIQRDEQLKELYSNTKEQFMVIGDSILDIQLGRKMKMLTAYIQLYNQGNFSKDDGVGDIRSAQKYGPTFIVKNYNELQTIISNPTKQLLAVEAVCQGYESSHSVRFWDYFDRVNNRFVAFRCLARQENGSCDKFSQAGLYYQIDNPQRSSRDLNLMVKGIENYLKEVQAHNQYRWDYFTYVSDKASTTPPNKMKEIFDLINTDIPKIKIFKWNEGMASSLRNKQDYLSRRNFIHQHFHVIENCDVNLMGKNIIVIDDQLTTGATAFEIRKKLEERNIGNILFIAIFYMSLLVCDDMFCPTCGKPLVIKTNRRNGNKFYSCQPPQYGGDGCGYTYNID